MKRTVDSFRLRAHFGLLFSLSFDVNHIPQYCMATSRESVRVRQWMVAVMKRIQALLSLCLAFHSYQKNKDPAS
jgi:hypothetical protein